MSLRLRLLCAFLIPLVWGARAEGKLPDDVGDDFVVASLLVVSPGPAVYQVFGHAALRMQCPSAGLDNVFSFETDLAGGVLGQFIGGASGRFRVIPAQEYIKSFAAEGRGVTAYRLDLTLPQKRKLWKMLDNAAFSNGERAFNMRKVHCLSMCFVQMEQALAPDTIDAGVPELQALNNAAMMDCVMEADRPWAALAYKIGTGSECDDVDYWRTRTTPLLFSRTFQDACIVSPDGLSRPLVVALPEQLVAPADDFAFRGLPPLAVAALFLLCIVALCVADFSGKCRMVVCVADGSLLALQTVLSFVLMLVTFSPHGIGGAWNWYLIVFNPLPLLLWLVLHGRPAMKRVYGIYAVVLVAFAAIAPVVTSEVCLAGSLVAVAMAIRCAAKSKLRAK